MLQVFCSGEMCQPLACMSRPVACCWQGLALCPLDQLLKRNYLCLVHISGLDCQKWQAASGHTDSEVGGEAAVGVGLMSSRGQLLAALLGMGKDWGQLGAELLGITAGFRAGLLFS